MKILKLKSKDVTHHSVEQNTSEWLELRSGLITSSGMSMINGVQGIGKTGKGYAGKIAWEMVNGIDDNWNVVTYDMQRGHDSEPLAFNKAQRDNPFDELHTVGFITNSRYPGQGTSLDSILNNDLIIEYKAPNYSNFRNLMLGLDKISQNYIDQVQHQMMVTDIEKSIIANYLVYNSKEYIHYTQVDRDEKRITFLQERIEEIQSLIKMYSLIIKNK